MQAATIVLRRSAFAQSLTGNGVTVPSAGSTDTTGLDINFIAVWVTGSTPGVTDSVSNAYVAGTLSSSSSGDGRWYFCFAPLLSATHTWTVGGGSSLASGAVRCYSGVDSRVWPAASWNSVANISSSTSGQPGSLTPDRDYGLVLSGCGGNILTTISVNPGSVTAQGPAVGGLHFACASSDQIQTTAAAVNQTFSWTGAANSPMGALRVRGRLPFETRPLTVQKVGTTTINLVGYGTSWTGSNTFSVTSGPASLSNYVNTSATAATIDITLTANGTPVVIYDSSSDTSFSVGTSASIGSFQLPDFRNIVNVNGPTNVGLDGNGGYLYHGDFTDNAVVITDLNGNLEGSVIIPAAPASSFLQGVAYDTSDGSLWLSYFKDAGGWIRNVSLYGSLPGTLRGTTVGSDIDCSGMTSPGTGSPNNCCYDAANDYILVVTSDNKIFTFNCATGAQVGIALAITGSTLASGGDGVCLDFTSPATRAWVSMDGAYGHTAIKSRIVKFNRTTGATVGEIVSPNVQCEGIWMLDATTMYQNSDNFEHGAIANGNRCWKLNPVTGAVIMDRTDILCAVTNVTLTTSSDIQTISGVGFPPATGLIFGVNSTNGAISGNTLGLFDQQLNQSAIADYGSDNDATADTFKVMNVTRAYETFTAAGADAGSVQLFSFTQDGLQIDVSNNDASAKRLHILSLASDAIRSAGGTKTITTGAGTITVSGLPFQPTCVIIQNNLVNTTTGTIVTTEGRFGIGMMTAAAQWAFQNLSVGGGSANTQGVARPDCAIVQIDSSLGITARLSFSSFTSDGFVLTKDVAPAADFAISFLALGGSAVYCVGSWTQPNATTGVQAITATGVLPQAAALFSAGRVANTTPTTGNRTMIGAAISSSARAVYASTEEESGGNTNTAHAISEAACVEAITDGGTPIVLSLADLSSFADGLISTNYSVCDATQRQNFFLAIGTASAVATAITLSGPSIGKVGVASTNFTAGANGTISGTVTVTPTSSAGTGTFTPTSAQISSGTPTQTFTYTPTSAGSRNINVTNNGGLSAPSDVAYAAVAAVLTGTAIGESPADVIAGGKTTILTLTGDTTLAAGAAFNAQRQAIINGVTSAQSETHGWNAEVRDKEVVGAVVRTSATVITITWSAAPAYAITAPETITATIPSAALTGLGQSLVAAPSFIISSSAATFMPMPRRGGHRSRSANTV